MNTNLTDESRLSPAALARAGRAPGGDHEHSRRRRSAGPHRDPRRRRSGSPVAAAAVVAMLAVGGAWWASGSDPVADQTGGIASQPTTPRLIQVGIAATIALVVGGACSPRRRDDTSGEMTGRARSVASSTDVGRQLPTATTGTSTDRRHIVKPAADGAPIVILDAGAQIGPTATTTTPRSARSRTGRRGSSPAARGCARSGYLALVFDQLRLTDRAGFEATLTRSLRARRAELRRRCGAVADHSRTAGTSWCTPTSAAISVDEVVAPSSFRRTVRRS